MSEPVPAWFISHGAPTLAVEENATTQFLAGALTGQRAPRAFVVLSAHWETPQLRLTAWERCPIVHDFYGFPEALYRLDYPAPGDPALAQGVADRLRAAGACKPDEPVPDPERGLDHGAWVPLRRMRPAADVPVLQLSLPAGWGPERLYRLGEALAPLRAEGWCLLGSGSAVHNLRALRWDTADASAPEPWAAEFDRWLQQAVRDWDTDRLFDYRRQAPHAAAAHPSDEHLRPLFFAMGAGADTRRAQVAHEAFMYGTLSMLALRFG